MKSITENDPNHHKKSIDLTIKLLLIIILLAWCGMIMLPFLIPLLWGIILAITLYPLYNQLMKLLKGNKAISSTIITLILLILLIVPSIWLISSIVEATKGLVVSLRDHSLVIPPPDPGVEQWPLIGKPVYNAWQMLVTNLEAAILQYRDQILMVGERFLGALKSVASNFVMMILSIIISGILLIHAEKSEKSFRKVASRLTGQSGEVFMDMIVLTIRNVAKGILGVAFIQFIFVGATLMLAQVPLAGLWALLVLLLAIVQLPVGIVAIPVVIYLYSAREPLPATLWSVLIILFSISDNFLKPWLMGKGAPVPTLVIFLGAIGGMIMSGFIGLFTGAIILSIGYKLVTIWLGGDAEST
jgi:predicted PurR-regulated permease PerM